MVYYDFTAGDKTYKLRINTRNTVELEKRLGCNPLAIFGAGDRIPTVTEMVYILNASLQQLNHGITLNDAYDIFDAWLDDGNTATDFITVILDIYRVSGLIGNDKDSGDEKNG